MNFSISRNSSWMSAWKKSQFCQTNRKTFTTCPSFRLWQRMFSTNYLSLRMENNIVPAFRDFRMVQTPFFEAAQWRVSKKDSSLLWRHSAKCMKWYWQYDTVVSLELSPGFSFTCSRFIQGTFWALNILRFSLLPYKKPYLKKIIDLQ